VSCSWTWSFFLNLVVALLNVFYRPAHHIFASVSSRLKVAMPFGAQGPPGGGRSDSPQAWYMSLPKVLSRALSMLSNPPDSQDLPARIKLPKLAAAGLRLAEAACGSRPVSMRKELIHCAAGR
jgi:hypothetical protein